MGKRDRKPVKASNRSASLTEQDLLRKIRLLLARGKRQRALEVATNATTLFRASHQLYNLAGVCAAAAEEPENAKQYWLRAVELNPNGAEAYAHLGQLYEKFNLLDEAEKYYRKEIAIDPDPVVLSNLGILLTKSKRYAEAEECYRQALSVNPGNAIAHSNLGVLLADLKQDNEAEQCYRKAISLDPDNPRVFSNLGVLLARNKRLQEAENCYRQAIAWIPDSQKRIRTWDCCWKRFIAGMRLNSVTAWRWRSTQTGRRFTRILPTSWQSVGARPRPSNTTIRLSASIRVRQSRTPILAFS
jgi:tetratricopeptide (TPR) repeat protein